MAHSRALVVSFLALATPAAPVAPVAAEAHAPTVKSAQPPTAKRESGSRSAPRADAAEAPPSPPALMMGALRVELARAAKEEQLAKIANEREALAKEKVEVEVEALRTAIADSRARLKEETGRLASLIEVAGEDYKPGGSRFWSAKVAQLNDPKAAAEKPARRPRQDRQIDEARSRGESGVAARQEPRVGGPRPLEAAGRQRRHGQAQAGARGRALWPDCCKQPEGRRKEPKE